MNPDQLLAIWASLRSGDATAGLVRRRLRQDAHIDIFACATAPAGEAGFLLEGEWPRGQQLGRLRTCKGLRITSAVGGNGDDQRAYLRILLENERLLDTFSVLATDLIEAVSGAPDMPSAMRSCIERLILWQGLMERVAEAGLSPEAQRGLFGELVTLARLMLPALGPEDAVSSWVGPARANQDFTFAAIGIEAKTTLSKAPVRLRIANELQLDDRGLDELIVCHVQLLAFAAHPATLPALVAELREQLHGTPVALLGFEQRLTTAGYLEVDRERYEAHGYVVRDLECYRVTGAFPRLTPVNLPSGVGDLTYSIAVDILKPYWIEVAEVARKLEKMRGR